MTEAGVLTIKRMLNDLAETIEELQMENRVHKKILDFVMTLDTWKIGEKGYDTKKIKEFYEESK